MMKVRVGVIYCNKPIVVSGNRVVQPLNSNKGIAVTAPALIKSAVSPAP